MPSLQELAPGTAGTGRRMAAASAWRFSLPLIMALLAYAYLLLNGQLLLRDGDTYWHVAAGQWILDHVRVPSVDHFSHTMPGAPWGASEWLSQVVYALALLAGGWTLIVATAALAFAATIGLLTRALLHRLEPVYGFLFAALAIFMSAGHALARPHLLAMPLMMVWTIALARAAEERRAPSPWLLPVMALWANLHGGFTLGLALAGAFALEGVLAGLAQRRARAALREWGVFLVLALACALVTPQGPRGLWFTWQVLAQDTFALDFIGEWQSPNFHVFQPLALWLLGGLALVLHQGLKLPPVRLALVLALLYLALKHARNIELLGLLVPILVAAPFGAQWRERRAGRPQLEGADRLFAVLARPAGTAALVASAVGLAVLPLWSGRVRPLQPPESIAPVAALRAVRQAHVTGPVLNGYSLGGYLIYSGLPVFIDGRSDMYRDAFIRRYVEALTLKTSDGLPSLLDGYRVTWTMLEPGTPAVALLDRLPGWRRLYADPAVVVHVRTAPDVAPAQPRP